MSLILSLGILTFVLSSFYFIANPKEGFNSAFLVSFITLISYVVMFEGNFVTNGSYWTRWVFYGFSCGLLSYEISKSVGLDVSKRVFNIFLTVITMLTGAMSAFLVGNQIKLIFFAISCVSFGILINEFNKTKSKALDTINPYIYFGWCVFPIVFLFSNEGYGFIPVEICAAVYLGLDIFTKIVFYIHQSRISKGTHFIEIQEG
jgi:bacteriorhodopsin